MNFFEGQKRARESTSRLVVLFLLAVMATTFAVYGAVIFVLVVLPQRDEFTETTNIVSLLQSLPHDLHVMILLGTVGFIIVMSLYRLAALRAGGGRAVVELFSVRRIESSTQDSREKMLFNVVEEMSIASGMPMPPVYLLHSEPGINAFAAGFTPADSVLAFSQGCLEHLNRDELQGVVAHEMSHVFHGDARLNVQLAGWLYGILCISGLGRSMLRMRHRGSSRSDKGRGVIIVLGLLLYLIGLVGYFFGRMIQAAISREREFLADASAVQYTRNPSGIGGALKKIRDLQDSSLIHSGAASSVSHFFFADALSQSLFSTHPTLNERIQAVLPALLSNEIYRPNVTDRHRPGRVEKAERDVRSRKAFDEWTKSVGVLSVNEMLVAPEPTRAKSNDVALDVNDRLKGARLLLDAIPDEIHQRLVDRDGVLGIPVILLLSGSLWYWRRSPPPSGLVEELAALGVQDSWDELLKMAGSIEGFTLVWRLKLVEIAAPALAENSATARLLIISESLIRADSKLSLFEVMLFAVMWHFSARGDAKRVYRAEIRKLETLKVEHEQMRSVVRLCRSNGISAESRMGIDLKIFATSLDQLSRLVPEAKSQLITDLRKICLEDGRMTDSEEAAIRALHLSLDCPESMKI